MNFVLAVFASGLLVATGQGLIDGKHLLALSCVIAPGVIYYITERTR